MANISSKLNLAGLIHVVRKETRKDKSTVECLIIPIDQNHLYRGEKGLYLDISHLEIKNPKSGQKDTHLIKQSLPKDVYAALSDEEKKAMPILGNTIVWGQSSTNEAAIIDQGADDDLPF